MNFMNPTLYGVSFPQELAFTQAVNPWQWQGYQRFVPPFGQYNPYGQLGYGMSPYVQQSVLPQYQQPFLPRGMGYPWPATNMAAPIAPMGVPYAQFGLGHVPWQRPIALDCSY